MASTIGEDIESSLLVVMQLKELGIETIVAKAVTPLHGRILEKLGVSRVIFPERDVAIRTAHSLVVPNALDYIELSKEYSQEGDTLALLGSNESIAKMNQQLDNKR